MQTIANEAQQMSLLFEYGVLGGKEIISWADSVIVKMDPLPASLLELSLTVPEKTGDIISHLHQLSSGSDFWTALRSIIPQIRDFIVAHPDKARSIANHLCLTACFRINEVPKDLNFMFGYDDAFSCADEGLYGEPQAVYHDFVEELNKFTIAA